MNIRAWTGVILMLFAMSACAGEVAVTEASVRATAPGQDTAAVALHIKAAREATLVAVSSPAAKRVEIHVMKHANGMMEMRAVESLPLPANQVVVLGSGSHIMLVGLKRPLKAGERVQIMLAVQFAGGRQEHVKVVAPVKALGEDMDMSGMDKHDMRDDDMGGHTH